MGTALSFVREATLLGRCETGLAGGHLGPALAPAPGVDPDSERPTEAWSRLHYDNPVVWHLPDSTYGTTPTYPGPHDPFLRFVCLSDTHGVVEGRDSYTTEVPDGDVLVHCGDFSMRGQPEEVARFDTFLERLPHPVKLVIAGNHELTFDERLNQSRYVRRELKLVPTCTDREVSDACKALLQHAVYLQDEHVDICGLRVYGSPWVPEYPQTSPGFSLKRGEQLLDKWRQIPATTDILVTHGPPCGYGDRSGAGRAGCVELLNTVVQRVKPLYHVFGHIHGEYGMWTNNTTTFINAAICDHLYHDVNPPIVFDCRLPASHTRQDFASVTTQSLRQARATPANAAQA